MNWKLLILKAKIRWACFKRNKFCIYFHKRYKCIPALDENEDTIQCVEALDWHCKKCMPCGIIWDLIAAGWKPENVK